MYVRVCVRQQFFKCLLLLQFWSDHFQTAPEGAPGGPPYGVCVFLRLAKKSIFGEFLIDFVQFSSKS